MKDHKNLEKTIKVWDKEFKKGYTSFFIIMLLYEKPMYGYELKSEIERITSESKFVFESSSIYQVLKKFKNKGFVTIENKKSEKGPQRKYYIISDLGRELAQRFGCEFVKPINTAMLKLMEETFKDTLIKEGKNE